MHPRPRARLFGNDFMRENTENSPANSLLCLQGQSPTNSSNTARVLIVHGLPVTRFGLVTLIVASGRFQVCAETGDVPTARDLFVQHRPELVVLGLTLHGGDGIELIKDFRKLNPAARSLVLTARDDALSMQRAFRAGAGGYLVVHDDMLEILTALDQVLAGELYASRSVLQRILRNLTQNKIQPDRCSIAILSDRELQVFSLIGRGFGATRLARELHLSVKTIETHQTRIKQKLELRNASELAEKATEWMLASVRRNLQARRDGIFKNGHSQSR
jgi:DNA-binding NarL/FixJ family response regulator